MKCLNLLCHDGCAENVNSLCSRHCVCARNSHHAGLWCTSLKSYCDTRDMKVCCNPKLHWGVSYSLSLSSSRHLLLSRFSFFHLVSQFHPFSSAPSFCLTVSLCRSQNPVSLSFQPGAVDHSAVYLALSRHKHVRSSKTHRMKMKWQK